MTQISCTVTAHQISAFVYAFQIDTNPKFQASCLFLRLYMSVLTGLVRNPEAWFSNTMAQTDNNAPSNLHC